jgi:phosphomevalonate kinase
VTIVVASAPGKIVISGEYAVLDGAPAICMAIDRRARVRVSNAGSDFYTARTSGYVEGEWKFRIDNNGSFDWIEDQPPAGGLDLLQQIWRIIAVDGPFDIELDTSEFFDPASHSKLGLGSSAALTAALVTALFGVTGDPGDAEIEAVRAHRRLQQGRGSGADIAVSLRGGIIEYRVQEPAVCRSIEWPVGLEYAVLWSGRPASTSEKLEKLDAVRRKGGTGASAARLCEASESVAKAWSGGSTAELLAVLHRYNKALGQFDVDHDLRIFDAGHRELTDAAAKRDLVYKPCGAGGGDAGMVLSTDRRAIAGFIRLAEDSGFKLLDVSLETRGALFQG